MSAWRKGLRRSTGDPTQGEGLPIWAPRSRGRTRRRILVVVGAVLVGWAALIFVITESGGESGYECGDAPAVAVALGVDTAAAGDGDGCRSEARSTVSVVAVFFLLPGALLLWRQWWRWRGVEEVVDTAPPPGSPSGAGSPHGVLPGESVSPGLGPG